MLVFFLYLLLFSSSLKAGRDICTEFTVSDCHPGPEHQIGDPIFENLPDFGDNVYLKPCEEACQNRVGRSDKTSWAWEHKTLNVKLKFQ